MGASLRTCVGARCERQVIPPQSLERGRESEGERNKGGRKRRKDKVREEEKNRKSKREWCGLAEGEEIHVQRVERGVGEAKRVEGGRSSAGGGWGQECAGYRGGFVRVCVLVKETVVKASEIEKKVEGKHRDTSDASS
eukprot:2927577-Pleurochrysis_carterae.AAC.3